MSIRWLLKMAWRDSRKNRGRLFLFMSSIVLGIAALVAINSFGENLKSQIDAEARELLGADLEVESQRPIPPRVRALLDSLGMQLTEEVSFASMVQFRKTGGTRLVNIRAVEQAFPFYGEIETAPQQAAGSFTRGQQALADQTLLLQFGSRPGDSIKVGEVTFQIAGSILKVPGQSGIASTVAPPVFIPLQQVPQTQLLQKGSRITYRLYAKYPAGFNQRLFKDLIKPRLEKEEDLRADDVAERKKEVGDAYADLAGFLNLTAFIALLLGCTGVASSVHVYMKEKVQSVAILRCLGAQARDGVGIYLVQIFFMGLIGSVVGAVLGSVLQFYLPRLFAGFLPFEVELSWSWRSFGLGVAIGVLTSVLFALLPLLRIRKVSPLKALRASYENPEPDKAPYLVFALILLFITGFTWLQVPSWQQALTFAGSFLGAVGVLAAIAQGVVWLTRRFLPVKSSFTWRQSLANLYRPNNQTLILIVTIGLGTALITTLVLSQQLLLDKIRFSSAPESRPNMVLFDIQDAQLQPVQQLTKSSGLPVLSTVPIITMRLETLKGKPVNELRKDTTSGIKRWVLNREYRATYRDSLTDSEKLVSGRFSHPVRSTRDTIFVSLEEGVAEAMQVRVGDPLAFNVQGAVLQTYVGSIRKIDWQRVQTNFLVVFPGGVLEQAPKFHVLLSRFASAQQSAAFQQTMVERFPNVSIIDLNLVLETIDAVLGRVSFVIRFMAFFSILTGLLVLIGSVRISKYQRIQESVLLRTLGASRSQIFRINTIEYFLLGSLASGTGILIALLASQALAHYSFNTVLIPDVWPLLLTYGAITGVTMLIGLLNSREVVVRAPLEILRMT